MKKGVARTQPPRRPAKFTMTIQGGMLEALGINMYTSIGKCLVEFIANAYDSDANHISIKIPKETIDIERTKVRRKAREEVDRGKRDRFSILLEPLPDTITIEISDDGHGMSPDDIERKFLPINRNRRDEGADKQPKLTSESGRRYVMGRKGLGKLAGFGAAEVVEIETKRKGENFATVFVLDYNKLKHQTDLGGVTIPATYLDRQPVDTHGTTIRLKRIKCDAVKQELATIKDVIAEAFYAIDPADFEIVVDASVSGAPADPQRVEARLVAYEQTYAPPPVIDGFASSSIEVEGLGEVPFHYMVLFRDRDPDGTKSAADGLALPPPRAVKRA
jgi:hypothetical protein